MVTLKKCNGCGKMSDLTTTCTYPTEEETIELCPTCLKEDGSFCLSCGHFCSGMESFDFIHPGYCDNCWEQIEADCNDWGDEEEEEDQYSDEEYPHGLLDY